MVKNLCMLKKPPTTISHLANRRYYLGRVQEQPGSCTMPWGCWIRDVRVYIPDCSCSSAYEPVVHSLVSSPLDLLMLPVFTTPHCNTVEKIVSCFLKKYFLPFFLMSFPINVIEHPWSLYWLFCEQQFTLYHDFLSLSLISLHTITLLFFKLKLSISHK